MPKKKALVLLSGGVDSASALWWAKSRGWTLSTLTFTFPGRRKKELAAARELGRLSGSRQNFEMHIPFLERPKTREACYIPKKNLMYYALAASLAEKIKADYVLGGHYSHDGEVFADAREKYLGRLAGLAAVPDRSGRRLRLVFPFLRWEKKKIIRTGAALGVPFGEAWSCSNDGVRPCRRCNSCKERRSGFEAAGVTDPLDKKWK